MQIDWLTVGAQIVNFLILVYLLKRFLYRPVLEAMHRREQRIADRLRDADAREREAAEEARGFRRRSDELAERRGSLLAEARQEAETERRRLLDEARADVREQRERWRAELEREWEDVRREMRRRMAGTVTEATRRALAALAGLELERAIGSMFQRRLANLTDHDRRALADGSGPIEIASPADLEPGLREELAGAVRAHLGREVAFVRADDLVGGMELRTDTWRMSWTVAEYLRDLDDRLAEALAVEAGSRHGRE